MSVNARLLAQADQSIARVNEQLEDLVAEFRDAVAGGADRTTAIGVAAGTIMASGNLPLAAMVLAVAVARLADVPARTSDGVP